MPVNVLNVKYKLYKREPMALIMCVCFVDRCLYFCFWQLCCLRYTDSDYPFGIFKLFLMTKFVIYAS